MTEKSKTVVFFGSGPVAAESLRLLQKHTKVEAVITKPTTAREMQAVAKDIPQFLVSKRTELDALIKKQHFKSSLGVLIDFGIIVSQEVIDSFELGIINSHFSILPEWRGPDPITFSILSGQTTTGVSLMLLVQKMDEGPIIGYGEQQIETNETTPSLTKKLIHLSDALLEHDLPRYLSGKGRGGVSQEFMTEHSGKYVSYSRKLSKEDGILDWKKPAVVLEREIRAYTEWPKSRTTLAKKDVVITSCKVASLSGEPGTVHIVNKKIYILCGEGALELVTLKPAGKKEMTAESFLAGHRKLLE